VHLAHQVGLDDAAEDLGGDLVEAAVGHRRRVVDPDVEAAEALHRRRGEGLYRLLLGDVERPVEGPRPGALAGGGDHRQRPLVARAEGQRGPAPGDPQRRRAADPARRAGDHHHCVLQRSRHASLPAVQPRPFSSAAL
jgi:hypothetical protein